MTPVAVLVGVIVVWWLWVRHRAAVITTVALVVAVVAVAHAPSAKAFEGVAVLAGVVGLVVWLCAGRQAPVASAGGFGRGAVSCHYCSYHGASVREVADHEAGHVTVAERLGYRVTGAQLLGQGRGVTWVAGGAKTAEDAITIAAAGSTAENLSRWWRVSINGSSSDGWSDAWTAHTNAVDVARRRGTTPEAVLAAAERDARRILTGSGASRYRAVAAHLRRDGQIGEPQS